MTSNAKTSASDKAIMALLARHQCPTPFAAVRTVLMGCIASPALEGAPSAAVELLWGGEMPEFATGEEAESLIGALIPGLWNRLVEHQGSREPFMLTRAPVSKNRGELHTLAATRGQEIAGFLRGLFGKEEVLGLPEKADAAVRMLVQVHGMFAAALGVLKDPSSTADTLDLADFARNVQQMTTIAEMQINRTIQACKRARSHREPMAASPMPNPVFQMRTDEPLLLKSPLCRQLSRHGVTVQVHIYGDGHGKWILEVIDQESTSHVWDDHFETDQDALAEATRALDEETMEFMTSPVDPREIH